MHVRPSLKSKALLYSMAYKTETLKAYMYVRLSLTSEALYLKVSMCVRLSLMSEALWQILGHGL